MCWRIGEVIPGKIIIVALVAPVSQGVQNRHEYGTKIQIQDGSLKRPVVSDGRQN
jgi:hypothetical protein